ncbi:MAG: NAD(P)-dependent oxidoreductase [Micropepsaceae bacterium]
MLPVMLDPTRTRIGLAGRGVLTLKRLEWFRRLGVTPEVFSDDPSPELAAAAGDLIRPRLPDPGDLVALDVLWIADLERHEAEDLFTQARAVKVLVNVEDDLPLCDFHTPSVVKRGRLVIAAGTGGASPAVASAVRARVEEAFPEGWADALEDIASARAQLRANGATAAEVTADAKDRLSAARLI